MGIANHAAGNPIEIAQQQIGGFPAHAGKPEQLLHGARDLAMKFGKQHLTGQHNVPGLVLIEAAGADIVFHIGNVRVCHGLQRGVGGKQGRGDLIDPGVGALGGQPDGDHQLIVLFVVQGAQGIGIALL